MSEHSDSGEQGKSQPTRARRIQVHVVTDGAQVATGAAVNRQRLFRPGKNWESKDGPIAGIQHNGWAVGNARLEFLIGMIQRNERGIPELAHSILIEGSWVEGRTVRRVSGCA